MQWKDDLSSSISSSPCTRLKKTTDEPQRLPVSTSTTEGFRALTVSFTGGSPAWLMSSCCQVGRRLPFDCEFSYKPPDIPNHSHAVHTTPPQRLL